MRVTHKKTAAVDESNLRGVNWLIIIINLKNQINVQPTSTK